MGLPNNNDSFQRKLPTFNYLYLQRANIVREALVSQKKQLYQQAISYYEEYLQIIAKYKNIKKKDIHPSVFNKSDDAIEITLICFVYWNLCQVYDLKTITSNTPEIYLEKLRSNLDKFKIFSIGYSHQNISMEIIYRFIRSKKAINRSEFKTTYQTIQRYSKKCYIATHCFGPHHATTEILRKLKPILLRYKLGELFVNLYYNCSPRFVSFLKRHHFLDFLITKIITCPILETIAFICKNSYKKE